MWTAARNFSQRYDMQDFEVIYHFLTRWVPGPDKSQYIMIYFRAHRYFAAIWFQENHFSFSQFFCADFEILPSRVKTQNTNTNSISHLSVRWKSDKKVPVTQIFHVFEFKIYVCMPNFPEQLSIYMRADPIFSNRPKVFFLRRLARSHYESDGVWLRGQRPHHREALRGRRLGDLPVRPFCPRAFKPLHIDFYVYWTALLSPHWAGGLVFLIVFCDFYLWTIFGLFSFHFTDVGFCTLKCILRRFKCLFFNTFSLSRYVSLIPTTIPIVGNY